MAAAIQRPALLRAAPLARVITASPVSACSSTFTPARQAATPRRPSPALRCVLPRPRSTQLRGYAVAATPSVKLYQYEICPFCCKVKAFLDWQNVTYKTVEVNPLSKAEIKFSKDYRKVPIAFVDEQQINDSAEILSVLTSKMGLPASDSPTDAETAKWLTWVDKEFSVLLFPNITRNFGESYQAFGYISEVPSFSAGSRMANRLVGSVAMWLANGKIKKKYNITDERKQLLDVVKVWTDAVGDGPFLRGAEPSLADIAVYGALSSIRGLSTHDELLAASPALKTWVDAVRVAVGTSARQEDGPPVTRTIGPTAA